MYIVTVYYENSTEIYANVINYRITYNNIMVLKQKPMKNYLGEVAINLTSEILHRITIAEIKEGIIIDDTTDA